MFSNKAQKIAEQVAKEITKTLSFPFIGSRYEKFDSFNAPFGFYDDHYIQGYVSNMITLDEEGLCKSMGIH
jgi:hypothetical protein